MRTYTINTSKDRSIYTYALWDSVTEEFVQHDHGDVLCVMCTNDSLAEVDEVTEKAISPEFPPAPCYALADDQEYTILDNVANREGALAAAQEWVDGGSFDEGAKVEVVVYEYFPRIYDGEEEHFDTKMRCYPTWQETVTCIGRG